MEYYNNVNYDYSKAKVDFFKSKGINLEFGNQIDPIDLLNDFDPDNWVINRIKYLEAIYNSVFFFLMDTPTHDFMVKSSMNIYAGCDMEFRQMMDYIPENKRIDIVINMTGSQIIKAIERVKILLNHRGPIHIHILDMAYSGGTIIALAGDRIHMYKNSNLGTFDPMIHLTPMHSALDQDKPNPIVIETSKRVIYSMQQLLETLHHRGKFSLETYQKLYSQLFETKHMHSYPYFLNDAKELGLNVDGETIPELKEIAYRYYKLKDVPSSIPIEISEQITPFNQSEKRPTSYPTQWGIMDFYSY